MKYGSGLIVIVALGGLVALVSMATSGPGFLAPQQAINVIFRDAQGIRIGSSVRVAGLDTGNVVDVDLVEVEGTLCSRVKISLPSTLVKKLRQDVKVSIVPALTGMSHVNVLSTGRSTVALVPGQSIPGVETSFFDPIIEQVGLGPVERGHLSHTIAEVRQTVDSIGPRLRQVLGSLQDTTTNLREMSDSVRPAVESTVDHVEDLTRKLNNNSPRIENIIIRAESLAGQAQGYLADNRENLKQTMVSTRDLLASVNDIVAKDRGKVERLLDGVEVTRTRADRVLYQADQIAGQVSGVLVNSRAEIERSVTNIRDATDWANRTVQKIYANPIVVTPFYKPSHEDQRVQAVFDMTVMFSPRVRRNLHDTLKTLEVMAARPASPQQQQDLLRLQQKMRVLTDQMNETATRLAEGMSRSGTGGREQRIR